MLVPLALSLADPGKVARTMAPQSGFTISAKFPLPNPLLDLWAFIDAPDAETTGASSAVHPGAGTGTATGHGPAGADVTIETPFETVVVPPEIGGPSLLGVIGGFLVVYALIAAVIAAGYIGGLDRRLRGEPVAIAALVRQYTPPFFVYHLLVFAAFLLAIPLMLVSPAFILLAIPVAFVLMYLFYAAPFLFVVADEPVIEALRRSAGYALSGGAYFQFALGHVAVGIIASIPLSLFVSTVPVIGFVTALAVAVPLSFVLTAATVSFCQELDELDGQNAGANGASGVPPSTQQSVSGSGDTNWVTDRAN
ncbi:hypothetical protein C483_10346 [Natrialba hulunbeirensis JCM 10989]|uniref:Uncharacterized protein n=1 Tax=Natrialba hulunbeirensis JCM 10989 TaxID=1227493 RepID=L9ZZS0_9EURY|nr:hypothetical protein [Natrialba hulunbeirensis]ELY91077.1 hypothetical protein C483_10346 [Natrialba hulunbeirensis JCM 10989]